MAKFVEIEHPDVEPTGMVTEEALRLVWAKEGWTKVTKSTKKQRKPAGDKSRKASSDK